MDHEELRRRAASIVTACGVALETAGVEALSEEQRQSLIATLIVLYEKAQSGKQSTPRIVDAYTESLASIGAQSLTKDQQTALDRFFNTLYEKAKSRRAGEGKKPPLVG
jgi:hypothetical protein